MLLPLLATPLLKLPLPLPLESKQQNNLSRAGITERTTCTIRIGVCLGVCVCGCVHKNCTANTESASEAAAAEYEL